MRTEKALVLVFLLGLISKFFIHFPGYSIMLIISLLTIATLYFPLGFYFLCDKKIKTQNLPLSIFGGMALAMVPVGVLFKIMYWPGSFVDLVAGAVFSIVIFLVAYIKGKNSSADLKKYYDQLVLRAAILTSLACLFLVIPSEGLIRFQYRQDPELARVKANYYLHPENEKYAIEYNAYMAKLDSINEAK